MEAQGRNLSYGDVFCVSSSSSFLWLLQRLLRRSWLCSPSSTPHWWNFYYVWGHLHCKYFFLKASLLLSSFALSYLSFCFIHLFLLFGILFCFIHLFPITFPFSFSMSVSPIFFCLFLLFLPSFLLTFPCFIFYIISFFPFSSSFLRITCTSICCFAFLLHVVLWWTIRESENSLIF